MQAPLILGACLLPDDLVYELRCFQADAAKPQGNGERSRPTVGTDSWMVQAGSASLSVAQDIQNDPGTPKQNPMSMSPQTPDILRALIDEHMPRRTQGGQLERRDDVARPYYFVRAKIPTIDRSGKRKAHVLGFCDQMTRKEALKARGELLDLANSGRLLLQSQIRFRDIVTRYKAGRLPSLGAATQARYLNVINNHILPAFGAMRMAEIDMAAVEAWMAQKAELGYWSRHGLKGILSAIFSAARDWGYWTGANPTLGVRLGRKIAIREKRSLTADQIRLILASVPDTVRLMLLVMVFLGLRVSEVLGLQWGDLDLDVGTVRIRRRWYRGNVDLPKSCAAERMLQLGPLVDELAPRRAHPDRWVFLAESGHVPPDERELLRFELRPVLKRLGLYYPGFGCHAFRRLNVTWRQHAGASPMEVQRAAGHSTLDMSLLYTLSDAERERQQVQWIADRLMGETGTKQ